MKNEAELLTDTDGNETNKALLVLGFFFYLNKIFLFEQKTN